MAGQSWMLRGQHVAPDLQSQLHVSREEGFVFDPKLPVKRRIDAFYSTCVPAALHGAGECLHTVNVPGFAHLGIG